jgi:hypothetical protein
MYVTGEGSELAKRDPNKTARNKRDAEITDELKALWPTVSSDTGIADQQSFNALIGGKAATFIDLKNAVIKSADEYISQESPRNGWMDGWRDFVQLDYSNEEFFNSHQVQDCEKILFAFSSTLFFAPL